MRNRKKFNSIEFNVWAMYADGTEEVVKKFKYKKAAERFVDNHTVDNGKFEIRELHVDLL